MSWARKKDSQKQSIITARKQNWSNKSFKAARPVQVALYVAFLHPLDQAKILPLQQKKIHHCSKANNELQKMKHKPLS